MIFKGLSQKLCNAGWSCTANQFFLLHVHYVPTSQPIEPLMKSSNQTYRVITSDKLASQGTPFKILENDYIWGSIPPTNALIPSWVSQYEYGYFCGFPNAVSQARTRFLSMILTKLPHKPRYHVFTAIPASACSSASSWLPFRHANMTQSCSRIKAKLYNYPLIHFLCI